MIRVTNNVTSFFRQIKKIKKGRKNSEKKRKLRVWVKKNWTAKKSFKNCKNIFKK